MYLALMKPANSPAGAIVIAICWLSIVSARALADDIGQATTDQQHVRSSIEGLIGKPDEFRYAVIIDCGSSGTRGHVYRWHGGSRLDENVALAEDPQTGQAVVKRIRPGLSSVRLHPQVASDYLQPIMKFVLSNVPEEAQDSTGVYVYATAGMRLLDPRVQQDIMADIKRDLLARHPFAQAESEVIPGAFEGMYTWISVNWRAGLLQDNHRVASSSFAVIEMGGASSQVTYKLDQSTHDKIVAILKRQSNSQEALKAFESQIVKPNVGQEKGEFYLASVSFLGLGSDSARDVYVDLLIRNFEHKWYRRLFDSINWALGTKFGRKSTAHGLALDDPCLPSGAEDHKMKPTRMLQSDHPTIGFRVNDEDVTFSVKLTGTGNYKQCQNLQKLLLVTAKKEQLNCRPDEPCSMSLIGVPFVPFEKLDFVGTGDLYYTTLDMIGLAGKYDRSRIQSRTKKICRTPYKDLLKMYPKANEHDESRVLEECFKATFMDAFLTQALGMPLNFRKLQTRDEIDGYPIDWTFGAVLNNAQGIEAAAEMHSLR